MKKETKTLSERLIAAENGIVTAEHVLAKARIFSEGAVIDGLAMPPFKEGVPASAQTGAKHDEGAGPQGELAPEQIEGIWKITSQVLAASEKESKPSSATRFTFDGSGLTTFVHANRFSRLLLTQEGDRVTLTDGDETLVTGYVPKRYEWLDEKVSNGLPVTTFLPGMSDEIINVIFYLSCNNYNTGRGCKYCNLFANPLSKLTSKFPFAIQKSWAKYQAEAIKIAIDNGWNGHLALSGGALPPSARANYLDYLRISLDALREKLGEKKFQELDIVYNHYPPEKLEEMSEWKEFGIKRTNIDLEVIDPAYFPAICPGKAMYKPLEYWKKAQEVSVKVFGPYANTTGNIVIGIEPMSNLLEGIEERLSKGVMPRPVIFCSSPNSEYWGFRPPTADWILEATDRMAVSYMKYIDFKEETTKATTGPTMLVFDMILHKMQGRSYSIGYAKT